MLADSYPKSDLIDKANSILSVVEDKDFSEVGSIVSDALWHDNETALNELAKKCKNGPAIGVGAPFRDNTGLYNAFYILNSGRVQTIIKKHNFPNEGVFDEVRLYQKTNISGPYKVGEIRIGTPICEDAWHSDVPEALVESGAELLVVPNGSPYSRDKMEERISEMVSRVVETQLPLVYLNMVGGQDDQVFDGGSFVLNPGGQLALSMPLFEESVEHVTFERSKEGWKALEGNREKSMDSLERDFFRQGGLQIRANGVPLFFYLALL